MTLRVDAQILKKLCRIFHVADYAVSFKAHFGEPGLMTVCAYDGIKFMRAAFDALVSEEGEAILSARYLDRVERLEGEVIMRYLKDDVLLKDSVRPFHIPLVVPGGPYTMPENKKAKGTVTLALDDLKTLIRRVRFATGVMESANLDCVLLNFGECVEAVGCDRRTAAIAKIKQDDRYKGQFLLPKQASDVLGKLEGDTAVLTLYNGGIDIGVGGDVSFNIYVPERSGLFPSYQQMFETTANTTMVVPQGKLMSVLSDMRLHSDEMFLSFTYESYAKRPPRFRARDLNGAHMERFAGKWHGRDMKLTVNARVLEQAVENISGEVTFRFANNGAAFSITSEDGNYVAILMPYAPSERK